MATNNQQVIVVAVASTLALAGFLLFSISTSSLYTPPNFIVSAQYDKFQNPGGPTIILTIQTSAQSPQITQLSTMLKLSLGNFAFNGYPNTTYQTLEFQSVTYADPLLPGDSVSQRYGWVGPSGMDDQVIVSGTFADGSKFSVITSVLGLND